MTYEHAIECGKAWNLDIIMRRGNEYHPCSWNEKSYAEECGAEYVGTVADCWKNKEEK